MDNIRKERPMDSYEEESKKIEDDYEGVDVTVRDSAGNIPFFGDIRCDERADGDEKEGRE